jgi:ATPase subunit of ABC transporter with duplicated ATPase domains
VKKLEKIELIQPPVQRRLPQFDFRSPPRSGDDVVRIQKANKAYGSRVIYKDFSFLIRRTERWCVMGVNGAGKSTLLKMIAGDSRPDAGDLTVGASVKMGYFAQHAMELLAGDETIIESLERAFPMASVGSLKNLAGAFGFSGDDTKKLCRLLSGGEKARLVMARLLYDPPNFLVLDEPTNHLDIPSAERLEEALAMDPDDGGFDGALLLVSHDRALLASTCEKLIVVDGHGGATLFDGTYDEWEERRAAEAKAATKESTKRPAPAAKSAPKAAERTSAPGPKPKRSPLDNRSADDLEAAIARFTARRSQIDEELASPALARDRAKLDKLVKEREKLEADLAAHEEAWLRKAETG